MAMFPNPIRGWSPGIHCTSATCCHSCSARPPFVESQGRLWSKFGNGPMKVVINVVIKMLYPLVSFQSLQWTFTILRGSQIILYIYINHPQVANFHSYVNQRESIEALSVAFLHVRLPLESTMGWIWIFQHTTWMPTIFFQLM